MHIHTHAHTHTRTHAHTHTRTLSSSLLPCQLHAHLMPSGSHTLRSWLMLAARFLLSTCCGPTRCLAQSTTQSLCTSSLSCIAGKWRYKEQKEGKEGQGQEEEEETTRISYFYSPPPKKKPRTLSTAFRYDMPWMLHNVVPFQLVGGPVRHDKHHMHGSHYFQKFFTYLDNAFGPLCTSQAH